MQSRAVAIPSQHVQNEGGARNHSQDVCSLVEQYTIRETVCVAHVLVTKVPARLITCLVSRFGPYFIEPVIAGIPKPSAMDPHPKPFICNMDT